MITANKLMYYQDRMADKCQPVTADIFLTDYCNLKCGYCRYANDTGRYIAIADFVRYLHVLLGIGVKGFILTGGGEPTINPDFDDITHRLDADNLAYGVNTNGVIFKPSNARFVKISVDEGDAQSYKQCRGADYFDRVCENIAKYCASRKDGQRIGVQCVVRNIEQLESFYKAVKDFGVSYIQFRPIEVAHHIEHSDMSGVLDYLDRLQKSDGRVYQSYKFERLSRPKACPAHWAAICVKVNGDVPVCCNRPEDVIGNILDPDIQQKYAAYVVKDLQKCEHPCRMTGANMSMERFETNDIAFI